MFFPCVRGFYLGSLASSHSAVGFNLIGMVVSVYLPTRPGYTLPLTSHCHLALAPAPHEPPRISSIDDGWMDGFILTSLNS